MAEDKSPAAKGGDKKGAKARAAPSRNRADGVNKFESCAKDFCDNELKSSYIYSLKEEPSASAVRIFKATFSKPTPVSPAPPISILSTRRSLTTGSCSTAGCASGWTR